MEIGRNAVHAVVTKSFPEEIIEEILTRLPVKSLARFRCVSKPWLSLITNPKFIKSHLRASINNNMWLFNRLLFDENHPSYHFKQCYLRSVLHEPDQIDLITLDHPVSDPNSIIRFGGSCNGMVCVVLNEQNLFLWNPSIRKCKRLPFLHVPFGNGYYMKDGFGYDESNDDYKVVVIFFCVKGGPHEVQIFSLKSDRWRRIGDFERGDLLDNSGSYTNGKLHWLTQHGDIISLDLASETYGNVVGAPTIEDKDGGWTLGLFSEESLLCMIYAYGDHYKTTMDVWVMKEYGVELSWARLFTIPHSSDLDIYPYVMRVWLLDSNEILLVYGCIILAYNVKENVCRYPQIEHTLVFQGDIYVESLVSPIAHDV